MLKILGRTSSINVRKVLWTCAEIGVPLEREDRGIGCRPASGPAFTAHRWFASPIERTPLPTVAACYRTLRSRAAFASQHLDSTP